MKKSLPIKSILVWKIRTTLIMAIIMFFCGTIAVFNIRVSAILFTVFILIYFYIMYFYLKSRYRKEKYEVRDKAVYIEKGVFFEKYAFFLINKIQYIELIQTFLQKKFNLCTLVFHLTGEKINIDQIEISDGIKLRDEISDINEK